VCVDSSSSSPTVIHVIPGSNGVGGVTSLGDDVFVVRKNNQQKIEVYDAKTFTLQRHITVPGLGTACFGLVACPYNNCLYASDRDNDRVHRVDLSGNNAVMKWSVAGRPVGLSVNSEHNLLVVSEGERKLQIFTTHGTLLQNIQLQANIRYPHHALQLPTGQFLLSHLCPVGLIGRLLHRVCLVGVDGAVDGGLKRLWYDQSRRRLYIGEWSGGPVFELHGSQSMPGPLTSYDDPLTLQKIPGTEGAAVGPLTFVHHP